MKIIHDLSFVVPLFIGLFWTITFLQSSLDKLFNWNANKTWIVEHFKNSLLSKFSNILLLILTAFEFLAGSISLFGSIIYLYNGNIFWIEQGLILSFISLLSLFFGQRIAKDYDGAKTIAIYFGVALVSALLI